MLARLRRLVVVTAWTAIAVLGPLAACDFVFRQSGFLNEPPFRLVVGRDFKFGAVTLNVREASKLEWAGGPSDFPKDRPINVIGSNDWVVSGIKDAIFWPSAVNATVKAPGQKVHCYLSGVEREVCGRAADNGRDDAGALYRPSYAIGPSDENEYQLGRDGAYFKLRGSACQIVFLNLAAGRVSGSANIDCKSRSIWPSLADTIEAAFAGFVVIKT